VLNFLLLAAQSVLLAAIFFLFSLTQAQLQESANYATFHGLDRSAVVYAIAGNNANPSPTDLSTREGLAAPPIWLSRSELAEIRRLPTVERVFGITKQRWAVKHPSTGTTYDLELLGVDTDFVDTYKLGDSRYLDSGQLIFAVARNDQKAPFNGQVELAYPAAITASLPSEVRETLVLTPTPRLLASNHTLATIASNQIRETYLVGYISRVDSMLPGMIKPTEVYIVRFRPGTTSDVAISALKGVLKNSSMQRAPFPHAVMLSDYFPVQLPVALAQSIGTYSSIVLAAIVIALLFAPVLLGARRLALEIALRQTAGLSGNAAILRTLRASTARATIVVTCGLLIGSIGLYLFPQHVSHIGSAVFAHLVAAVSAWFIFIGLCYSLCNRYATKMPLAIVNKYA
jgi:hypothetical protein